MKYRTISEYKDIVRAMSTREVEGLAETYNGCQSLGVKDIIIKDILNDEMERRIAKYENRIG